MNYSKIIYNLLSNDAPVTAIIADRIGNVNLLPDLDMPYLVFRQAVETFYAKDSHFHIQDMVSIQVNLMTKEDKGIIYLFDLAEKIRTALAKSKPGVIETFNVNFIRYDGQDPQEYHKETEAYITPLNFTMQINR